MDNTKKKFTVSFYKADDSFLKVISVEEGTALFQAGLRAGIELDAPCGGHGKCGKCKVLIKESEVTEIWTERLSCQTRVEGDLLVRLPEGHVDDAKILGNGAVSHVFSEEADRASSEKERLVAAVDIGSTTVVAYLMERRGSTTHQLGVKSAMNPQIIYGADVVSRCSYAMEQEDGREMLSSIIREKVNELIVALAAECGKKSEEIELVTLVGNSGMHHLFLGLDTKTLALAPYTPATCESLELLARDYGIRIAPEGRMIWLPLIGGFVGADTVGCLVASDMDTDERMTLILDIGTNGEMVLGNCHRRIGCSTAAGPAFEGAKITCGMRGSIGAIDQAYIRDGELYFHVIGETKECFHKAGNRPLTPKGDVEVAGLCGSGLLDVVACLLEMGWIEESGRMEETFYFTDKVFLNQKDVRELQLAKAAIAAGIDILCQRMGIEIHEIERLQIAGAFGNYMNPVSAGKIRMIPPVLVSRVVPMGNAAGEGAKLAACSNKEWQRSKELAKNTEFVELALDPGFQDVYVDELSFETDEDE